MDYVTQLQNEYKFFSDMLKKLEKTYFKVFVYLKAEDR